MTTIHTLLNIIMTLLTAMFAVPANCASFEVVVATTESTTIDTQSEAVVASGSVRIGAYRRLKGTSAPMTAIGTGTGTGRAHRTGTEQEAAAEA